MEKINDDGQLLCPICDQYVDQEMLWKRNGVTACDDCVGDGNAPTAYYN